MFLMLRCHKPFLLLVNDIRRWRCMILQNPFSWIVRSFIVLRVSASISLFIILKISEQYGPSRCCLYDATKDLYLIGTNKNCIVQTNGDWSEQKLVMQV